MRNSCNSGRRQCLLVLNTSHHLAPLECALLYPDSVLYLIFFLLPPSPLLLPSPALIVIGVPLLVPVPPRGFSPTLLYHNQCQRGPLFLWPHSLHPSLLLGALQVRASPFLSDSETLPIFWEESSSLLFGGGFVPPVFPTGGGTLEFRSAAPGVPPFACCLSFFSSACAMSCFRSTLINLLKNSVNNDFATGVSASNVWWSLPMAQVGLAS